MLFVGGTCRRGGAYLWRICRAIHGPICLFFYLLGALSQIFTVFVFLDLPVIFKDVSSALKGNYIFFLYKVLKEPLYSILG